MESANLSTTDNGSSDSKTSPVATSPAETSHVCPSKKPRSRCHSSCSSSSDEAETSRSNAGVSTKEETPVSSTPKSGQCSDNYASEEPAADAASPSPTSSRIPSYVFARKNSSGNMEWSVASNESLFSIHMGNTSFTRDQMSWVSKSSDLGYQLNPTFSGPLIDLPSSQLTPDRLSIDDEIAAKSGNLEEEYSPSVAEAAAAETMRDVIREKESQANKDNVAKESSPHSRSLSQHSDTSVKSFAFPILTGDSHRSSSFRPSNTNPKNKKLLSRGSTPKTTPQSPPESPKQQTPTSQTTPKETRNPGPGRWLSCFPCCPSCS